MEKRSAHTKLYKNWRSAVLEKDKYECQHCGVKEKLHAHHIEPYFKCKEKRYDVNNGLTLCISCHGREDAKGRKCKLETRLKMSKSHKGKKISEIHRNNIRKAKTGLVISSEIKEKISKKLMGNIPWNKGKKLSQEHKIKLSLARKGKIPWNKGKPLSDETKKKLSLTKIGKTSPRKGVKLSEEIKKKISESKKRKYFEKTEKINDTL